MIVVQRVESPDTIERQVLFAVELVDPITNTLVYRDVMVKAEGLSRDPIVSRSGRFIWLVEGDTWPGEITVTPHRIPFAAHRQAGPPRPADLDNATPNERTVRITLRPTAACPVDAGITAVRGWLRETPARGAPAMPNVRVQLAWRDDTSGEWTPRPPLPEAGGDDEGAASPREVATDAKGQFVAFLRLRATPDADPDLVDGMLKVRMQFTRGRANPSTRVTPNDFRFLPEADPPEAGESALSDADEERRREREGRVFEGRVLSRDLTVAWSALNQI